MGLPKPLLVGELNPYGTEARYALYPEPLNSAGDRLCRVVMGMTAREYLRRFDRMNLCRGRWSDTEARSAAAVVMGSRYGKQSGPIVLLGAKVSRAFGKEFLPYTREDVAGIQIVILPHPSGRNLLWNAGDSVVRARDVLRDSGVLR